MVTTVNDLLKWHFVNRPRVEKINIVLQGKPRPSLPSLQSRPTSVIQGLFDDPEKCLIVFDTTSYDHVEWLTGCDVRHALYCWPCLLFSIEKDVWNRTGIKNLNDLRRKIDIHSKCKTHIQSCLELQLFLPRANVKEPTPDRVPEEVIKRNREITRRIIDTICALIAEEHPKVHGYKNRVKPEDCVENLQFIREYSFVQISIVDDAVGLLKTSPEICTEVVKAITQAMKLSIQEEMQQSNFVSLILSEHSRENGKSMISVVARYLKKGEVCERFIEFISMDDEKSCSSICNHMSRIIRDFQISHSMLAFSLDGCVYPDLYSFNKYVDYIRGREDELLSCCQSHFCFIPCHFHKLDQVLKQCLSLQQVCDIFFKTLESLRSYFSKGSKTRSLFKHFITFILKAGEPELDLDGFDSEDTLRFLKTIRLCRVLCIRFFECKLKANENWAEGEIAYVIGFCAFLKDFATFFLLEVFIKLFSLISPLEEALYSDSSERIPDAALVDGIYTSLLNGEDNERYWLGRSFEKEFGAIYKSIVDSYKEIEKSTPKKISKGVNNDSFYYTLYGNILKKVVSQVKFRFLKHDKIGVFNVSNLKRKGQRLNTNYLKKVTLAYVSCFDYSDLEKEMESLENDEAFLNCASVHEMMELFLKSGLDRSCPNLYTLMELVLTLPSSVPNLKGGPSKLAAINLFCDTSDEQENVGDLSLMCIELDFLVELKKRYAFHNEVMDRFQEINRSFPLANV